MLKGDTIYLRMLNAEDWEKTYLWHNDNALQKLTCGPVFEVSKEIEKSGYWRKLVTTERRFISLFVP